MSVPVLLYHSVTDSPSPLIAPWTIPPSAFRNHVDAIVASGANPITMHELAAAIAGEAPLPPRPVAITFDDGYADNLHAADALVNAGLPATIYITTAYLGRDGFLDDAMLADLAATGVSIGSHACTHRPLDELSLPAAAREIADSKSELEDRLSRPCDGFAYPHGFHTRTLTRLVAHHGYFYACGVKNALSHAADDRYAIARLTVTATTGVGQLNAWLRADGPLAWEGERLQTLVYRRYRRLRHRRQKGAVPRPGSA